MHEFSDYLRENIIWDKGICQPPIGNILGKRYEYVLVFTKSKDVVINDFRNNMGAKYKQIFGHWISNLIKMSTRSDQTNYSNTHRAGFPLELPKVFIDVYTKEGDIVLDPFSGLSTTAIAAKRLHRNYIGIELSEKYIEIGRQLLRQETLF